MLKALPLESSTGFRNLYACVVLAEGNICVEYIINSLYTVTLLSEYSLGYY